MKTFYSNQLNDFVADEMCQCGHLKSEHGSLTKRIKNILLRNPNSGSCCGFHCECKRFVFSRFVTVDERISLKAG
jgi:hypothetical protein